MSIHPFFIRPTPTALAPILFPVDSRGQPSLDDLLYERLTSDAIGFHGINHTRHRYDTVCQKQLRWSQRLNAKIAQVEK